MGTKVVDDALLLLLALSLPLLVPALSPVAGPALVLLSVVLAVAVVALARWRGAFGCVAVGPAILIREALLVAAVSAAIGTAGSNSLASGAAEGFLHGGLALTMAVLFAVGVVRQQVVPTGVGVVLALASPVFGPGVETLHTDVAATVATAALIVFRAGAGAGEARAPAGRLVLAVRGAVLLLMVLAVLATLAAAAPGPSSLVVFRYLTYLALPLLLLGESRLAWGWLAAGPVLASGALAVTALAGVAERIVLLGPSVGLYHRVWTLDMHPAHLGHWFVALFPLALALTQARGWGVRLAGLAAAGGCAALAVLSYSRSAWTGLALGGLCFGVALLLRRRTLKRSPRASGLAMAGALVLLVLVLVLQGPARSQLATIVDPRSLVLSGRVADLAIGWRMVAAAPLLGHGPNARSLVGRGFERSGDELPSEYYRESGHNAPLKLAGELGLPAGLLFTALLVVGALLLFLWRLRGRPPPPVPALACAAAIAALGIPFLIGGLLDGPHALFWVLLGAAVSLAHEPRATTVAGRRWWPWPARAGALLLALAALWPATVGEELRAAIALDRSGQPAAAESRAALASRLAPWLVEPYRVLALVRLGAGDVGGAGLALERAVARAGNAPDLAVRLADLELRFGRPAAALERLDRAGDLTWEAPPLELRVRALLSLGRRAEAAAALADLLAVDPLRGDAGLPRALVAQALEVARRRIAAASSGLAIRRSALAWGRCLEHLGLLDPAATVYERLGNALPRDPEIWRQRARIAGELKGDAAAARVLRAALAADLRGPRAGLQIELGRRLLGQGRAEEARPLLEAALAGWRDIYLDPFPAYEPLAQTYHAVGEPTLARRAEAAQAYLARRWPTQLERAVKDSPARTLVEIAQGLAPVAQSGR